ncbi:hypothetical protein QJS66_02765 [Kocuria rhizophila]|nr:hypothetical protein QJS66_02765 [Kocuria rhizophila]
MPGIARARRVGPPDCRPEDLAARVVLVGCAPGGTASNVVSYLARGDVAVSVTVTSMSTLLAPLLAPLLTLWLAGAYMPLNGVAMARSHRRGGAAARARRLVRMRLLLPG